MIDYRGQQMGNYRLSTLLGQGGFAQVYLAEHICLNTSAAIKILQVRLTDKALEKFLSEARTVARFSHPHIIQVLEFGIEHQTPFLVMHYAPYGSLRKLHPAGSVLSSAHVLPYVQQIASALQYAHDRLVIHRDVKPENILLAEEFALMLSDFGLATTLENQSRTRSGLLAHQTQSIVGTLTYMAPEQFDGTPSAASDQYALAVLLYEWLCGAPPFQGSEMGVALHHLQTPPPPLREKQPALAPSLEAVVLRALAKDPKARFPSVAAFASALAESCPFDSSPSRSDQHLTPMVLPSIPSTLSDPPFALHPRRSRLHESASATVADQTGAPEICRLATSADAQSRSSLSRRKVDVTRKNGDNKLS